MSITIRTVEALAPGGALWDDKVRGFGVRRQRRDAVYVLKHRVGGRQRFITIGRHGSPWTPELARKEALKLLGQFASGNDPSKAGGGDRVVDVIEAYLHAAGRWQRPTSRGSFSHHLRVKWAPLHAKRLGEVTRRDVALGLRDLSPSVAATARMSLSAFFNWCLREGYDLPANPVTGSTRPKINSPRDRVLTNAELAAVWHACPADDAGRVIKLLILTGCRLREIANMSGAEVSGDLFTIPASRSKNKQAHTIPLAPLALSLLPEGTGRLFRAVSWSWAKAAIKADIPPWVLHDLRRSVATGMADLGILPHVIEEILNHRTGKRIASIYNRARYAAEVRDALTRWSDHIAKLVVQ